MFITKYIIINVIFFYGVSTLYMNTSTPFLSRIDNSLVETPLGRLSPISHCLTVDKLTFNIVSIFSEVKALLSSSAIVTVRFKLSSPAPPSRM